MTDTPTPGQVNFEAFLRALVPPGQTPWHWLGDAEHAAWEAAAQAVLDAARDTPPPTVLDLYEAMGEVRHSPQGTRPP